MSRKHRQRNNRKNLAWPVLIFGGILLIVAAFLFANRSGGNDGGGTPQMAVDPQKIDYGYVQYGNNKTFKITVTNNGDGVLRFKEKPYIEVLEGC